jgi:hypothetical protein
MARRRASKLHQGLAPFLLFILPPASVSSPPTRSGGGRAASAAAAEVTAVLPHPCPVCRHRPRPAVRCPRSAQPSPRSVAPFPSSSRPDASSASSERRPAALVRRWPVVQSSPPSVKVRTYLSSTGCKLICKQNECNVRFMLGSYNSITSLFLYANCKG